MEIIWFLPAAGHYLNPKLQLNVNEMLCNNDGVVLKPFFNILEKSYFCIFGNKILFEANFYDKHFHLE